MAVLHFNLGQFIWNALMPGFVGRDHFIWLIYGSKMISINIRRPKMEYWKRTNQTKKLRNSNFIRNNNNNLTLKHISGAFYTLVVCLVFCIVVFVQELIYFHQIKVQLAANRRRILQTKIRSGTKIIVKTNKTM